MAQGNKIKHNEIAPRKAAIWAITACVLWSTAFVAVKAGLAYSKPFSFAGNQVHDFRAVAPPVLGEEGTET